MCTKLVIACFVSSAHLKSRGNFHHIGMLGIGGWRLERQVSCTNGCGYVKYVPAAHLISFSD